jgi:uncharacterized membrane protein (UPF0127 family)
VAYRRVSYAIASRVARNRWCHSVVGVLVATALVAAAAGPRVAIRTATGQTVAVTVEVAATPAKRERGLMFRKDLGAQHGMLFLFPREANHAFWMKNTPLPLDIIFIDRARHIVGIQADTVPYSLQHLRGGGPSQYILEVNAGFCARTGVQVGDQLEFHDIDLDAVT